MKMKCPNCGRIMKEFEPTERERDIYFDDEELVSGEALFNRPCSPCLTRNDI